MCRFVVYLGPPITLSSLITEPTHSLIHQSYHSRERTEPLNGDGFGVGWYVPPLSDRPAVFRSISPAWSNRSLRQLCRVTRSDCVFAHIRAASPGLPVIESNCHPFCWRDLAFMHNGRIAEFRRLKRTLQADLSDEAFHAIEGSTDSEHVFALLIDRVKANGDLSRAIQATLGQVVGHLDAAGAAGVSQLNLAVTDGRRAVVTRFTTDPAGRAETLYLHEGRSYVCEDGVCRMIEPGEEGGAVLISSEALSDDPGWKPVPVNHMVIVEQDRSVRIIACGPGA